MGLGCVKFGIGCKHLVLLFTFVQVGKGIFVVVLLDWGVPWL
jgi:hypothetical protein